VPLVGELGVVRDVTFAALLDPIDLRPAGSRVIVESHGDSDGASPSPGQVEAPLIGCSSPALE
jgi:hypothetical protein